MSPPPPIAPPPLGWILLALGYAVIFLTILILAYTGNLPGFTQQLPYYDTIGHVVLYSLASYLGHRLLRTLSVKRRGIVLPFWPMVFGLLTVAEELLQLTSPNRTFSGVDLLASLLGIVIGYRLAEKNTTNPSP